MTKLISRWYISLLIVPVLLNYFTDKLNLSILFKNWLYTTIGILLILVLILSYELFKSYKFNFQPKPSDKKIVKELLESLNVDSFQQDIKEQDSWNGYRQSAIESMLDFIAMANLISYKTSDKRLNLLINELRDKLEEFHEYSSTQLYGNTPFYAPAKDNDVNIEKAKKACPIMNKQTHEAFNKLVVLMDYLKKNNYLE